MKKSLIICVLVAFTFVSKTQAQAASQLIGYTNIEYILSLMPEMKGVKKEIQDYTTQLRNSLEKRSQKFQQEATAFQQTASTLNEVERKTKERELTAEQDNLMKMQQDSESSLQKKQMEALQPLYTKIQTAIKAVRKEKGYDMILNDGVTGVAIVFDADEKYDVTNDVLKKLGITPPAIK